MKIIKLTPLAIAVCLGLIPAHSIAKPDHAKNKGESQSSASEKGKKGKDHKEHKEDKKDKAHKNHHKFEHQDREAILKIFRTSDGKHQLPPGLAKNLKRGKALPPGWQKKLNPGYRIEDEIWKSFSPISYDMVTNLKKRSDASLYYHDNKVYRIMNATREILDVISVE